jgi:hypothetical protein
MVVTETAPADRGQRQQDARALVCVGSSDAIPRSAACSSRMRAAPVGCVADTRLASDNRSAELWARNGLAGLGEVRLGLA